MIELHRFEREDLDRLIEWSPTQEFLMQWAGPYFSFPLNEEQLERYYLGSLGETPVRRIYKVLDCESSQVIGHIELNNIDQWNRSATLSRVLLGDATFRGRGFGYEMAREVTRIGFEELGLHRIELAVFDFNHSAKACYERIGYRTEGHMKECRRVGEDYWSIYWMAILADEWRNLHGREGS